MQLVPRGPTSPSPLRIARFDRQCPLHRAVVVVLLKFHRFNHLSEPALDASVVFGSPHSQPQGEVVGKRDRDVSHCTRTVYDDSRLHLPVPSMPSLRQGGTADPILANPNPECDALTELNPLFLDRRVRDGIPGGRRPLPVEIDHQPSRIAVTSPESAAGARHTRSQNGIQARLSDLQARFGVLDSRSIHTAIMSYQTGWDFRNLKFGRGVYTDCQIDCLVHVRRFTMPSRFFLAIAALLVASGLCSSAFTQDLRSHVRAGSEITPEKAESLEAELVENPEDLVVRAQLVGYQIGRAHV